MAEVNCKHEVNADNLITDCLLDTDQVILLRMVAGHLKPFRTTYLKLKNCLIAPPAICFYVDDLANIDTADVTYPLGGGTIFFSSTLIGRRSVIVLVNNVPLPRRNMQPDYYTPNFTTGEITRPNTFKSGDYVEVIPL